MSRHWQPDNIVHGRFGRRGTTKEIGRPARDEIDSGWLSDAEFRALSPSERRRLFAMRGQAKRKQRAFDTHQRSILLQDRRRGWRATLAAIWPVAFMAVVAITWQIMPPTLFRQPAVTASGATTVHASFASCKWGGGFNCVVDGDTIYLEGQKIRIAGIDAPETHDYDCASELERGERAADRLRQLLNSGTVTLTAIDRDEDVFGRKLRNIAVDGADVGETLVVEGVARDYAGGRRPWC